MTPIRHRGNTLTGIQRDSSEFEGGKIPTSVRTCSARFLKKGSIARREEVWSAAYCTRASLSPATDTVSIIVAFGSTERKLRGSIHNLPPSPYPATASCVQDETPRQGPKTPIRIPLPAARTENCLSECVCP